MDFLLGWIFFGIDFFFSLGIFFLYIFFFSRIFFFCLEFFFLKILIFLKKIFIFCYFVIEIFIFFQKKNYQQIFSLKSFLLKSFFIKKIYGKKVFVKKINQKKKNLCQNLKIILSFFLYKHLQVYYVYLQTLHKVLVIFHSSHVLPYRDIPWT